MKTFGPCKSKPILMSLAAFGLMEKDSYGCNRFPELCFLIQNHRISESGRSSKAISFKSLILHVGKLRSRQAGSGETAHFSLPGPMPITLLYFCLHPFQGPMPYLRTQRYNHLL